MKKTFLATLAVAALAITSLSAHAQKDPTVGGAAMYPTKTIVENAVNSPINKTLVAAVKAGRPRRHSQQPRAIHSLRTH